jgi:hypothetical protein
MPSVAQSADSIIEINHEKLTVAWACEMTESHLPE